MFGLGKVIAWLRARFGYAPHIDPPVWTCETPTLAEWAARQYAAGDDRLTFHPVANTGSMVPLIPKQGGFLVSRRISFLDLLPGVVAVYQPDWHPSGPVVHRLVAKDGYGFIASGDNNARSESWDRVTPTNFLGEVVGIWTWKQPA